MCGFKPGDEVVCVDAAPRVYPVMLVEGRPYTITAVDGDGDVQVAEASPHPEGLPWFYADRFRKVECRNDSLSIEAFLTIRPGFEEPKRDPAKKRERA